MLNNPIFRFSYYFSGYLVVAFLAAILGFFLGFYFFLSVLISEGHTSVTGIYHSYDWGAWATILAAIVATGSAATAIHNTHYQRREDQKNLVKMLAFESLCVVENIQEMLNWLEDNNQNNPNKKFHQLNLPMGFDEEHFLIKLRPIDAQRIGEMRRYIKTYIQRNYSKRDDPRFSTERENLLKEFGHFIQKWEAVFGAIETVKSDFSAFS